MKNYSRDNFLFWDDLIKRMAFAMAITDQEARDMLASAATGNFLPVCRFGFELKESEPNFENYVARIDEAIGPIPERFELRYRFDELKTVIKEGLRSIFKFAP